MPIHNHIPSMIVDDDTIPLFSIDSVSREIICNSEDEIIIMQNDANSERLSFEIDEYIEGHNMMDCNVVQIHYINTGANGTGQTINIYNVTDLSIVPTKPGKLKFSWLVSRNATKFIGNVRFAVRFFCTNSAEPQQEGDPVEGQILYEWSTGVSSAIRIGESIRNNTEIEDAIELDILSGLKQQLMGDFQWVTDPSNPEATEPTFLQFTDKDDNVITSVNLKSSVKGDKGDKGDTPTISVGTVKTTDIEDPEPSVAVEHMDDNNNPTLKFVLPQPARDYVSVTDSDGKTSDMWFFVGTEEEYTNLEDKNKFFALITDDEDETFKNTVKAEIVDEIENIVREETISNARSSRLYKYYNYSLERAAIGFTITKDNFSTTNAEYYETVTSAEPICTINNTYIYDGTNTFFIPENSETRVLVGTYKWGEDDNEIVKVYALHKIGTYMETITGNWLYFELDIYFQPNKTYTNATCQWNIFQHDVYSENHTILPDEITYSATEIFECNLQPHFVYVHKKLIATRISAGDYLLDVKNNNLYEIISAPDDNNKTKLLLIKTKQRDKQYRHYVYIKGKRTYTDETNYDQVHACFTYISPTKTIQNHDDVVNDLLSNYPISSIQNNLGSSTLLTTRIPCSGSIYDTSDKSYHIIHSVRCVKSDPNNKTNYLSMSSGDAYDLRGHDFCTYEDGSSLEISTFEVVSIEL